MTNVLIVEDSRISREAFVRLLSSCPGYHVLAAIENAANAEIACMHNQTQLVLMDICTAEDESGLEAAARIKKHYPQVKVIIMTSMPEYSFLQKAKAAGCDSFWYKEHSHMDLLEVCDLTMAGRSVWPDTPPVVRIGLADSADFTLRELDVIRYASQGLRYEDIAKAMNLSVNTVKYHIRNILQKTGCHNMIQLVTEVVEKRLVLPKY